MELLIVGLHILTEGMSLLLLLSQAGTPRELKWCSQSDSSLSCSVFLLQSLQVAILSVLGS